MKNIIIAGPGRAGKTTLAKKINEELNYFVINLDKLMTAFGKAYPQLDVRIAWDRDKATNNIAPFLGHFLGLFSSNSGMADDLNLRSHFIKGNRFVLEGGHFDFEQIGTILKLYGINDLADHFMLIGLVQNKKTANEFLNDLRKYDTEDEWTYNMNDDELKELVNHDAIPSNQYMAEYLSKYGFSIYDTSTEREQVLDQIIKDIKSKFIQNDITTVNISEDSIAITQLLKDSFIGVAEEMGFTPDNCPNHVAFITHERVLDQLGNEKTYCFGIRDDGKWIGFVAVAPYGDSYEITRLAVAPKYRHKGYGRALIDRACDKARELGLKSIGLGMLNDNVVLKNWYEAQGFIAGTPFIPAGASFTACGMSKQL